MATTDLYNTISISRIHGNYVYCWDKFEGLVTRKHFDEKVSRVIGHAYNTREAHKIIIDAHNSNSN